MIEAQIMELLSEKISGEWGEESMSDEDVNVIRTANFTNIGEIRFANIIKRSIDKKIIDRKKLMSGDIIIEKSGGSPNQPVGRVVYFEAPDKETYICNNFTTVLRPNKEIVHPRYFFYLLYYNYQIGKVLSFQNKTTGIINLKLDRYLNSSILYEPNLDTQNKIVTILDKANSLVKKREETIAKYDELLRATFLTMFLKFQGNNTQALAEVAYVVSGLTKGKKYKDKSTDMYPYMRVANVQDGYLDLNEIKEIEATKEEAERYRLEEDDLLLTEGGDPDKLGRGTLWKSQIDNCIYQNHIFRVRVKDRQIISPTFLSFQLSSQYGKAYFLKAAKQTSGIASINSTQLKAFPVYLPPIEDQIRFERIIQKGETNKVALSQSLQVINDLNAAISQLAFNGGLTFNTAAVDLEVFLNKIDPEKEDKENDISAAIANNTLLHLLITRLKKQEFETFSRYKIGKYVVFRILKEYKEVIQQQYNSEDEQIELTV